MDNFYVNDNAQVNGDHEVHKSECNYLPVLQNRSYLGIFSSCHGAVEEAKKKYNSVNGCYYCCYACHTS
jgi:hypothetical protein